MYRAPRVRLIVVTWIVTAGLAAGAAEVRVETVRVSSAGGIELATDIYHPAVEPAPVVLIRTPYGRTGFAFLAEALVDRGYAVAMQDVRGRYDSSGEHEPFRHEETDGIATLEWLAAQPWCNGRIGMWGSSYSGYAALAVADADIEAFRSIFSISGWLAVEEVVRPGGANHLMLNLAWMLTQQGRTQRSLDSFDVDRLFAHTPMKDALKAAGIRNATWEDPRWMEDVSRVNVDLDEVRRPVFQLTGWHDMVYRATLDAWSRVAATGNDHKLAIGPWYHNQFLFGSWEVGDVDFGTASAFGTPEMIALTLEWFDATLRGVDNGMQSRPPVTYFVMGSNSWHPAAEWPPVADVAVRRWHLGGGGKANGAAGDGALLAKRPAHGGRDHFVFDPDDPVPTLGGANFFYFPEKVGVRDQREIERRDDVLVYTSAPLTEPLWITGAIRAHLRVASSAPDTDFTAKLVVVRPDGYARIVEEGITRVSRTVSPPPEPGSPFDLTIALGQTAISVPAGHRLRLEVSSSNFPKYDRNPNTGEDAYLATELKPARQTVFHHGSWLELPLRSDPPPLDATARRPLIAVEEPVESVARVEGSDAAKLRAEGRVQLEAADVDRAIATFSKVVELEPGKSANHHLLGEAYLAKLNKVSMFKKLGLSKKVLASYRRAVELDADNLDARTSLAEFYFNAPGIAGGDFAKGLEHAEVVAAQDAKRGHLLLAGAHAGANRPGEAIRHYRAAIAAAPSDPAPRYRLGVLLHREARWAEAFDVLEAAVRETGDPRCLYQLGRTSVLSGQRLDAGRRAFERYIAEAKGTQLSHANWRLGMIHELQGRPGEARKAYETALKLDPQNQEARDALESLPRPRKPRRAAAVRAQ